MPEQELLPKWFRVIKSVATELATGFVGVYLLLKFELKDSIPNSYYDPILLVVISLGIPCLILSCSNIIEIFKKVKPNGTN